MFSRMPFRKQLLLSFVATLVLLMGTVVLVFTNILEQQVQSESRTYLRLLTEQVLSNFHTSIASVQQQLFTTYQSVNLATYMLQVSEMHGAYNTVQDLQLVTNKMVSVALPFDFVYVITLDDYIVHTGQKMDQAQSKKAVAQAEGILGQPLFAENNHGKNKWVRTEDGGLFLIRDVYIVSPLKRVGRMAVRIRQERLVQLGDSRERQDFALLFFDKKWNHVTTIGNLHDNLALQAQRLSNTANLDDEILRIGKDRHYVVVSDGDEGWQAIGMMDTGRLEALHLTVLKTSIVVCALGILLGVFILTVFTRRLYVQIKVLMDSMNAMARGDMNCDIEIHCNNDIGQLAVNFGHMRTRVVQLLARVVEEETRKKDAEYYLLEYRYRSLQNQINPHFICNALETINAIAKLNNVPKISKMVQVISRYFRKNTNSMNKRFVTVMSELDTLREYIEIYRSMCGERLNCEFECVEEAKDALIPTMILQPIIENALVHGMKGKKEISNICIRVTICDDRLRILVCDNGPGMTEEVKLRLMEIDTDNHASLSMNAGIGIPNVVERLFLVYKTEAVLIIDSAPGCGTKVAIDLPLWYIAPVFAKLELQQMSTKSVAPQKS